MIYFSKKNLEIEWQAFLKWAKRDKVIRILIVFAVFIVVFIVLLFVMQQSLLKKYKALESVLVKDRHGKIISTLPNSKGEYSNYIDDMPQKFRALLVKKEDKFFYIHPGINPVSIVRAIAKYFFGKGVGGSSTITQQLTKNLLGNENNRTIGNKFKELLFTFSLEIFKTKKTILIMYANTVYMGNNIQGFNQASIDYFNKELKELNDSEFLALLATLSNPSKNNPQKSINEKVLENLAVKLKVELEPYNIHNDVDGYVHKTATSFEFDSLKEICGKTCTTTLDRELTEKIREILSRNIYATWDSGARNGAVVVIKLPENELLAIVGSPKPSNESSGHGINMAIKPRPIGSTIKPFIYMEAFKKGLRPYTLAEDREYKYPIATGYSLYPKNYDGLYHGTVTLHESLSNSYNVPTVKTLEYVGLSDFYGFLEQKLAFVPIRDLNSYQFGIALGGLEMDPLTLAYYFSIFPERGILKPLKLFLDRKNNSQTILPPMSRLIGETKVAEPKHTELVTKILNDRKAGVEQFGLESSLNLTQNNYAVKTGTSHDYHDSWTVGFTPDYIVAVWLGNAENEPLRHVTGQSGAGQVWNEVMELLINSDYNHKTKFNFDSVKAFLIDDSIDFGLQDDIVKEHRNLLQEKNLILNPHEGDTVLLGSSTAIPLRSSREVSWYINDVFLDTRAETDFYPKEPGTYSIRAVGKDRTETILINIKRN